MHGETVKNRVRLRNFSLNNDAIEALVSATILINRNKRIKCNLNNRCSKFNNLIQPDREKVSKIRWTEILPTNIKDLEWTQRTH
jgi:hypothetical protein